ncbi:MAG TPA: hypothetical protein VNR59_11940 [Gaiellaceae bacterium]|nr:hypothetical protein [Gaiellaceae bacterium]
MERARRHQKALARLAFVFLALIAELIGRSLAHRFDVGRHVATPSYSGADYYPILLAVVKVGIALMLARVAWRAVRAARVLSAHGRGTCPRVRFEVSPRLWFASFVATSLIYLMQMDAEGLSTGRWPLLSPWLHTSALPVFAVLSVVVAVLYRAVELWLSEYETLAKESVLRALRGEGALPVPHAALGDLIAPRSLFGLAFEVRPPPLAA